MASQQHTWIALAILVSMATRLVADQPVVQYNNASRLLVETSTTELLPISSVVAGGAVGCDDFVLEGCDAAACGPTCSKCASSCSPCCCCPFFTVTAEAMFLRRSNGWDQILVTDQNTGATRLSTSDFDDDYSVIPRLQIIRQYPNCHGWEVNLFGISSFDSDSVDGGPFFTPQYTAPGLALPSTAPGTAFRTDYETEFDSLEINYRRNCCRHPYLTLIAGFRWLELSDELDVDQVAPLQRDLFSIDTNNRMYGVQTGLDAVLFRRGPRFYIDSMFRAGVFYNRVDQTTFAPLFSGAAPVFTDRLSARDNHTAFFSELGFHGVYQLTDRFAVRAGYRLMWLEGAALAPNQIPVNSLVGPGTAALDTDGSLFLDGATVGASFTY